MDEDPNRLPGDSYDMPPYDPLIAELASRLTGGDIVYAGAEAFSAPLQKVYQAIKDNNDYLDRASKGLSTIFSDVGELESILHEGRHDTLNFMYGIFFQTRDVLVKSIDHYQSITANYDLYLKPNGKSLNRYQNPNQASMTIKLVKSAVDTYLFTQELLPKVLDSVNKLAAAYHKYLKDRFIKSEEQTAEVQQRMRLMRPEDMEEFMKPKYVKIKLIDDNPVLTDTLLHFMSDLPSPRERIVKSRKGKEKRTKETSIPWCSMR